MPVGSGPPDVPICRCGGGTALRYDVDPLITAITVTDPMKITESLHIWRIRQIARTIWFRATFYALLSVAGALIALAAGPLIPGSVATRIGANAVGGILEILASSMLIVATFSLSTVISAYAAASSATTPRATELLMQDSTAQNALSTFVGAFLFSLVGIIGLRSGFYGEKGHIVLFALTIVVVIVIVVTFLRWVGVLSNFGRVQDAIERTARAATAAVNATVDKPCLGGRPAADAPEFENEILLDRLGYVRFIDVAALQKIADELQGEILVRAPPGAFLGGNRPIVQTSFAVDDDLREEIASAFDIGDRRSFDQDPMYGVSALAEIGIKALSPGINDPETASRVIDRLVRVLGIWCRTERLTEPEYDRVYVPVLDTHDLFAVAFSQLALYGARDLRVGIRLQEAFRSLASGSARNCHAIAKQHSKRALEIARKALDVEVDYELLEKSSIAATP